MSFFSSTADDPVAWRRVTAMQSDFPSFTDILKTSDNAKKKNNLKKWQKDVLNNLDL